MRRASTVRTLTALKRAGLLEKARGVLIRRATDPWESHLGGIMNTLVPEEEIPSHQGPEAQTVDPDLDVVTMAVKAPETLAHLHYWTVQLTRPAAKEEVLDAVGTSPHDSVVERGYIYWYWDVSPIIVKIGPLTFRWYGLLFGLAFLIGYFLVGRMFRQEGKPERYLDPLLIYMVVGTVRGTRFGHVLFYDPGYYFTHPAEILNV